MAEHDAERRTEQVQRDVEQEQPDREHDHRKHEREQQQRLDQVLAAELGAGDGDRRQPAEHGRQDARRQGDADAQPRRAQPAAVAVLLADAEEVVVPTSSSRSGGNSMRRTGLNEIGIVTSSGKTR